MCLCMLVHVGEGISSRDLFAAHWYLSMFLSWFQVAYAIICLARSCKISANDFLLISWWNATIESCNQNNNSTSCVLFKGQTLTFTTLSVYGIFLPTGSTPAPGTRSFWSLLSLQPLCASVLCLGASKNCRDQSLGFVLLLWNQAATLMLRTLCTMYKQANQFYSTQSSVCFSRSTQ